MDGGYIGSLVLSRHINLDSFGYTDTCDVPRVMAAPSEDSMDLKKIVDHRQTFDTWTLGTLACLGTRKGPNSGPLRMLSKSSYAHVAQFMRQPFVPSNEERDLCLRSDGEEFLRCCPH